MDNFYIKVHIGAKQPFYKLKDSDFFKSQSLKDILDKKLQYKKFDAEFLKNIALRQLLHSFAICESMPVKVDLRLDKEVLKNKLAELKKLYQGIVQGSTDWRLALGLGNTSVFETSITLHNIYGIPYIPSSAIKGILRSWIITEYFSNERQDLKNAECRALQNLDFCRIFGAPGECERIILQKGKEVKTPEKTAIVKYYKQTVNKDIDAYMGDIVFFDAFPIEPPTVEVDIMNPHYPEYYQDEEGKVPPADWQNPKPIFFLTIKDTKFQFLFGLRKGRKNFEVNFGKHKGDVIPVLRNLLTEALSNHGIGAKTAVGYGRFKE